MVRYAHVSDNVQGITTTSLGPRDWLEEMEQMNQQQGGVYTVMRCDLENTTFSFWAKEFHLQRLQESAYSQWTDLQQEDMEIALRDTKSILTTLLDLTLKDATRATSSIPQTNQSDQEKYNSNKCSVAIMVTILWQLSATNCIFPLVHVETGGEVVNPLLYSPSDSAVACVAPPDGFPNRHSMNNNPRIKHSSWCRIRRPLEHTFKRDANIVEVVLTKEQTDVNGGELQLLEGLTSNLFIISNDGTLKTNNHDVLHGCARKLVLESAQRLGLYNIELGPIGMQDLMTCKEVFFTSSIRLIVPVYKLVDSHFVDIWKAPFHDDQSQEQWRLLYQDIAHVATKQEL